MFISLSLPSLYLAIAAATTEERAVVWPPKGEDN